MRNVLRGPSVALVTLSAAVLAGAACTGDGGTSKVKFSETECASCIETACGAEIAACTGIADCNAALECTLDCPAQDNALDTDCAESECADLVTTSAGGTAYTNVVGCYLDESPSAGTCGSECAPPSE